MCPVEPEMSQQLAGVIWIAERALPAARKPSTKVRPSA